MENTSPHRRALRHIVPLVFRSYTYIHGFLDNAPCAMKLLSAARLLVTRGVFVPVAPAFSSSVNARDADGSLVFHDPDWSAERFDHEILVSP